MMSQATATTPDAPESAPRKAEHVERFIECEVDIELTDGELAKVSTALGEGYLNRLALEQKLKETSAGIRAEIKEQNKDLKRLAEECQSKRAKVKMQCIEVSEFPNRVAVYRPDIKDRKDPRALVSQRAFTKDELHVPMFEEGDLGSKGSASANDAGDSEEAPKKKRGRPPGSKNKPKAEGGQPTTPKNGVRH